MWHVFEAHLNSSQKERKVKAETLLTDSLSDKNLRVSLIFGMKI